MKKKILITGITGFAGGFLAEHLLSQTSDEIIGTSFTKDGVFDFLKKSNRVKIEYGDLKDKGYVQSIIKYYKPDLIFHLAALASPADSFKDPLGVLMNNISVQVHLLESIKNEKLLNSRILITSSAEIYGQVEKKDLPMDETLPLRPDNPYSVSKAAQDLLGLQYFSSYKLQIVRVRPFNHIGPRQSANFSIPSFAKRIAQIEKGLEKPEIFVGNLDSKRDFTDVRDMVYAYLLLLEKGLAGDVYNIGSGKSISMKNILEILLSFSRKKIKVVLDRSLFRPSDIEELLCNSNKMEKVTGWKREISLEKTLQDTLDYWRNIV